MNRIILIIAIIGSLVSCKQDNYLMYTEADRLQFGPVPEKIYIAQAELEDTLKSYTFLKQPITKLRDTVYFDLYTMGNVSDRERAYSLVQEEMPGVENAVAGVHYVDFTDDAVKPLYTIPAGRNHVRVPVVLIRDDAYLSAKYYLKLKVKENESFKLGDARRTWRKLVIADMLLKPAAWNDRVFGTYSQEKHKFMTQQTGIDWDQAYILSVNADVTLTYYWQAKFRELLYSYNQDPTNPVRPLVDEFGKEISF